MSEDRLRRLKSFREALDGEDAILIEIMRANSRTEISLTGARPIKQIFDEISGEFPDLIQKLEHNGTPFIRELLALEGKRRANSLPNISQHMERAKALGVPSRI